MPISPRPEPSTFRLGRREPDLARLYRHPQFESYVDHAAIHVPPSCDWTTGVPGDGWGMLLNDELGDCVIAAMFHVVKLWTSWQHNLDSLNDDEAIKDYESFCGYVPGDPASDRGCMLQDSVGLWRTKGLGFGHSIAGSAVLEHGNLANVREAIYLFGAAVIGLEMPLSAQDQVGKVWTVTTGPKASPGSWGGHAVPIVGYAPGVFTCVTWGKTQRMTEQFYLKYCDEAHAVVSRDWTGRTGTSPVGFDLKRLIADCEFMPQP